jgi:hypothetical protein
LINKDRENQKGNILSYISSFSFNRLLILSGTPVKEDNCGKTYPIAV